MSIDRRRFIQIASASGGGLLVGALLDSCSDSTPAPTALPTSIKNLATNQPATATTKPMPTDVPTILITPTAIVATTVPDQPFQANLFIRIDPDQRITLTIHRSEMGQGVRTALAMILADELEADWAHIHVEQSPANSLIGSQITSGSGSITDFYSSLRHAGATARAMLILAAAAAWGVAANDCYAEQSYIFDRTSSKKASYGELAGRASQIKAPNSIALKKSSEFRLIGKPIPRIDEQAIVTGKAIYGLDVRLPGMHVATVARCPVLGGKVADFDDSKAKAIAGVVAIIPISTGIAVVAKHTWAAIQGRAALTIRWDEGALADISTKLLQKELAALLNASISAESDPPEHLLEAIYETPYLAHAPMEPLNAFVNLQAEQCQVWAATQNPQEVQNRVRNIVGVPTNVEVPLIGGGFGRRLEVDYAVEAAEIAKAAALPVQVVWTREDDLQHDFYRQATQHWLRAGWDAEGKLTLWRHIIAAQGIRGIVYQAGNEVLEEGLKVSYNIADQQTQSLLADHQVPTGPWRAVISAPNAFANECFLDEVAFALAKDPYALRMELLSEFDLLRPVLELAANKANWGSPLAEGVGRGIACHNTYGQTAVAMVAEVAVSNKILHVQRVVCAIDCGMVIQPDMVAQQVEGGIVFGLTALLHGSITIQQGRVQQKNFQDYQLLTIAEMPLIEVYILPSKRDPRGVGEMAVPPITPAVLNALFQVTGKRIRRTPLQL